MQVFHSKTIPYFISAVFKKENIMKINKLAQQHILVTLT